MQRYAFDKQNESEESTRPREADIKSWIALQLFRMRQRAAEAERSPLASTTYK
jgi:hypothetical protein